MTYSSSRKLLEDLEHDINKLRNDVNSRITDIPRLLGEISGRMGTLNANSPLFSGRYLRIPGYLKEKLEIALKATNPELHTHERFPLARGLNAFHRHWRWDNSFFLPEIISLGRDISLEQVSNFRQYLELMKCIWIIQKIEKSDEYKETSSDRLWNFYMIELKAVSQPSSPNTTLKDIEYITEFRRNVHENARAKDSTMNQRNFVLLNKIWIIFEMKNSALGSVMKRLLKVFNMKRGIPTTYYMLKIFNMKRVISTTYYMCMKWLSVL